MNQSRHEADDALISLLREALVASGGQGFSHLVLYTSFGVVQGRTGLGFAQVLERGGDGHSLAAQVVELNEVTVEHYSNHLPTANFGRFYIRLREVQGFALVDAPVEGM
jgi:hypothetical protein